MAIHALTSHLLTALVSFGAGFGYYGAHKLDGLSAEFSSFVKSSEQKVHKVATEASSVLQLTDARLNKANRPLLQNLTEALSENISYLGQVKVCGVENAITKTFLAAAISCLGYYGYKKYQNSEDVQKPNEDNQKLKEDVVQTEANPIK